LDLEFNEDKLRKISSEILSSLERLEDLRKLTRDTFASDEHKIGSAKYNLIVAIEGIIDLCNHIIAKNGYRTPEDYADTFRVMAERNAFMPEFTNALIQMVRFRNRLVHIYWEVDNNELYRIMQSNLQDIRRFLKEFGQFIGAEQK
jgi:uncharacterized protein YutE (UPF0331/DUF86 family)